MLTLTGSYLKWYSPRKRSIVFQIYINDIDDRADSRILKSADDIKLYRRIVN